jgi:hypothetical protein
VDLEDQRTEKSSLHPCLALGIRRPEFFVEVVPQGELTPKLYKLKEGDTMPGRKVAKGRFTIDVKSGRTNHLLLATVTGSPLL